MSHFPLQLRNLPKFDGPFDAHKLTADGCFVLFASYPAGISIPPHTHETDNVGVITQGELILSMNGAEQRFGVWGRKPHLADIALRASLASTIG